LQENTEYKLCDIHTGDKTGIFFKLHPTESMIVYEEPFHGGTKSKPWVTLLLAWNA
jgi:hypothetical protein